MCWHGRGPDGSNGPSCAARLQGWASRLDNEVRIMEILKVMIPTAWNYRFPGAVDRLMRASTATVR